MSATVIDLSSRRRAAPQTTETSPTCPCRIGYVCRSHRVSNLADSVRAFQARHCAELLTPTADLDVLLEHALTVLDGITAETYDKQDRSTAR